MSAVLSTLERFAVADPALLAERSLLKRVDSKFVVGTGELDDVLSQVTQATTDGYGIVLAGGQRLATYRTRYFDTPSLVCFHDHRRGRRPRQKVRIRHYDDRGVSFLEIKTKRSQWISRKARKPQSYGNSEISEEGLAFVAENSRLPADELRPAVRTDFQRATLVGLTLNERITIDVNLVASHNDDDREPIELTGVAIVEVKQPRFSTRSPIMRALLSCGHRPAAASKYCTATALFNRELRINRLLPALRAIERLRQ